MSCKGGPTTPGGAPGTGRRTARFGRLAWRLGVALLLLAVLVVLVRAFVADVYLVDGDSMAPALLGPTGGPEAVLVAHGGADDIERFDLVVLLAGDGGHRVVKRIGGLPGERVQAQGGDLLIDGERLGPEVARPAPVPLFDQALHDVSEHFHFEPPPEGPWTPESDGSVWRLDARDVPTGASRGLMLFRDDLTDSWIAPGGEIVRGRLQVNDGVIECEVRFETAEGRVRLWLVEEGDTFELVVTPGEGGRARVELLRRNPETMRRAAPEPLFDLLEAREIDLALETWHHLRLGNVDDHLAVDVDGRPALVHRYAETAPYEGVGAHPGKSLGARAALGGEGVVASFRGIRVLRDLFFVPVGEHGVEEPLPLGPDEYFVLGDNSADSLDSRQNGPVPAARILGRPRAVVWPPGRVRVLLGVPRPPARPDGTGTAEAEPGS